MKNKLMLIIAALSVLLFGCQYFDATYNSTPVREVSEPQNVSDANVSVSSATVVVLSPSFSYQIPRQGNVTFYFLQTSGDMMVIRGSGNETVLVDTGSVSDFNTVAKFLRNLGVESIDAIVLTRNSDQTSGNLAALSSMFEVGVVYSNGLGAYNSPLSDIRDVVDEESVITDEAVQVGSLQLRFILPYDDGKGFSEKEDDNSILVKTVYGSRSVLYASGCGIACEGRVRDANVNSLILVTALRGSCDASTTYFLQRVNPDAAVTMGTVCAELDSRLSSMQIKSYSTGKDGVLAFSSDGSDPFIIGG